MDMLEQVPLQFQVFLAMQAGAQRQQQRAMEELRRLRADGTMRVTLGKAVKAVFDIADLVNLIISFADDESLHKMADLNRRLRGIILSDSRYKLRIVTYKFKMCQKNLDRVLVKIQNGELIDTKAWNEDRNKDRIELYLNQLALKYPTLTNSFNSMKAGEQARLLSRVSGIPSNAGARVQAHLMARQKQRQEDYFGDAVLAAVGGASVRSSYGQGQRRSRAGRESTLEDILRIQSMEESIDARRYEELREVKRQRKQEYEELIAGQNYQNV